MEGRLETTAAVRHLWAIVSIYVTIGLGLFLRCGFRFDQHEALLGGGELVAGSIASGLLIWYLPIGRKTGLALNSIAMYLFISMTSAVIAICAATLYFPLRDAWLIAADRGIGYCWQDYALFFSRHRYLGTICCFAYESIQWQPILICMFLAFRSRSDRLMTDQLATLFCLVVTIAFFAVMPVTTAWLHDGAGALLEARRLGIADHSDAWTNELLLLRSGGGRTVPWDVSAGIIGFPSFHCAAAMINGWALWSERDLRMASLPLNAFMIAATPIFGGHYVVDLLAGSLAAVLSVQAAKSLYPRLASTGAQIALAPRDGPNPLPSNVYAIRRSPLRLQSSATEERRASA